MSYKNLEYKDQYREFLKGALKDLGCRILEGDHDDFAVIDKNGRGIVIDDTVISFLMGATVATIGKFLDETRRDEE